MKIWESSLSKIPQLKMLQNLAFWPHNFLFSLLQPPNIVAILVHLFCLFLCNHSICSMSSCSLFSFDVILLSVLCIRLKIQQNIHDLSTGQRSGPLRGRATRSLACSLACSISSTCVWIWRQTENACTLPAHRDVSQSLQLPHRHWHIMFQHGLNSYQYHCHLHWLMWQFLP